jgi:hypothetical protein
MPAHFNLAYAVNEFEHAVNKAQNADALKKDQLVAQALSLGSQILDEVIEKLDESEYQQRLDNYSHLNLTTVFSNEVARQRFIETEIVLLRLSGYHDSQIEKVVQTIDTSLISLQSPPKLHRLTQDLREIRDKMAQVSQNIVEQKVQASPYITWLNKPIVVLFGGLSLIILDGVAESIIPIPYVDASIGVGGTLAANVILAFRAEG